MKIYRLNWGYAMRSHIKHIYTKLDVHSRQELLSFIQDASYQA